MNTNSTIITCPHCGDTYEFDENDVVIMMPFPHYECPTCGEMLPAF